MVLSLNETTSCTTGAWSLICICMQLDDGGSHYRFCFIHFFFQSFSNDIGGLPKELVDRVALLPELLKDSRASSTVKSYHSGFIR